MNAAEILAIPVDQPERLFTKDGMAQERLALIKEWHPDRNKDPDASEVVSHVLKLYDVAVDHIATGWVTPGLVEIPGFNGKKYVIRFQSQHAIEIGTMYVGRTAITFLIDPKFRDLYERYLLVTTFKFPSHGIKDQINPFLPSIVARFETPLHLGLVLRKTDDVLLLREVMAHFGGELDPRHAAWLVSRLFNMACFLHVTGLVHPVISQDTVFISPPNHTAPLLGGWWFAARQDQPIEILPAQTTSILPGNLLKDKRACKRMTGEAIKALGREIMTAKAPKAVLDWLHIPASEDAIEDYRIWREDVLKAGFGERRFTVLDLKATDIYK